MLALSSLESKMYLRGKKDKRIAIATPKTCATTAPYNLYSGNEEDRMYTKISAKITFDNDSMTMLEPREVNCFLPCITPRLIGSKKTAKIVSPVSARSE